MSRFLTYLLGPETVLAALTAVVFWLCARYPSGEGRDVAILEQCVVFMPFVMVPLVFATVFVPGAKSWWWLGRAILLTYVILCVCAGKFITGFGSGAKGQDAAFILVLTFGTVFIALGSAITSAMILAVAKPVFGEWFRAHKIMGSILTLISAVPIGFVLGIVAAGGFGLFAVVYSAIKR